MSHITGRLFKNIVVHATVKSVTGGSAKSSVAEHVCPGAMANRAVFSTTEMNPSKDMFDSTA